MTNGRAVVLLAEDDENDQFMVRRSFEKLRIPAELQIVSNGQEAIDYLTGHGNFADRVSYPFPALIVLDIKMPRRSGLEVLEWIRNNEPTRLLPVVIVSSSSLTKDVRRAYELGVNAYLTKPNGFHELAELFRETTDLFVHRAARLPAAVTEND